MKQTLNFAEKSFKEYKDQVEKSFRAIVVQEKDKCCDQLNEMIEGVTTNETAIERLGGVKEDDDKNMTPLNKRRSVIVDDTNNQGDLKNINESL